MSSVSEKFDTSYIGEMIMCGFRGTVVSTNDSIVRDILEYHIGGLILYDRDFEKPEEPRNVVNPEQLRKLVSTIQSLPPHPLFIAVDQEGGKVARLNQNNGFFNTLSAHQLGDIDDINRTKQEGELIGSVLAANGINFNFAPVVDINSNPQNPIIGRCKRSFSADPYKVITHSRAFIEGLNKYNIINCIKHFPGHGSSINDSHNELTDVTDSWSPNELTPYEVLIREGIIDCVMTAHIINKKLDQNYPASLSRTVITDLLRNKLSFDGVVVSDDLGMKAISAHYDLEETIYRAINAGTDILLFSNMMAYDEDIVPKVHKTISTLIEKGKITSERIRQSSRRIQKLKAKLPLYPIH